MEIKTIWFGCNVMWSGRGSRSEIAGDWIRTAASTASEIETARPFSQTPGPAFGKDDEAGGEERQPSHDRGNLRETEDTCSSSDTLPDEVIANVAAV